MGRWEFSSAPDEPDQPEHRPERAGRSGHERGDADAERSPEPHVSYDRRTAHLKGRVYDAETTLDMLREKVPHSPTPPTVAMTVRYHG